MLVLVCAGFSLWGWPADAADRFLPAEQAFRLSATLVAPDRAELRFDIAPGYYMYRAALAVQAEGAVAGPLDLPPGIVKFDENFGQEVETYHVELVIGVPLREVTGPVALVVQSQGCAEAGLCYPVNSARVSLQSARGVVGAGAPQAEPAADQAGSVGREHTNAVAWVAGLALLAGACAGWAFWRTRRRRGQDGAAP